MPIRSVKIVPSDHGWRMSLSDFEHADAGERIYELNRGIIVAIDTPPLNHLYHLDELRSQLFEYDSTHLGQIYMIASAGNCKIVLYDFHSERHPDLALYKLPPYENDDPWPMWVPEIVVEVVIPESRQRDYVEKREEYLAFGVAEYWIVDGERRQMTALRRRGGRWDETLLRSGEKYRTRFLKGFELDVRRVLEPRKLMRS